MYVYIFFSSESLLYVKSKVGVGYIKEHMVYIFLFFSVVEMISISSYFTTLKLFTDGQNFLLLYVSLHNR